MLGVFKIQVVLLGAWEAAVHGASAWLRSLRCWTGLSCRLLVTWEPGKKHEKELMCGWKKRYKGASDFLSGVSSAEGEVSISLLNLDKRFYSRRFFAPHCAKPVRSFSWHFLPHRSLRKTSKEGFFFPHCKRNQTWPFLLTLHLKHW